MGWNRKMQDSENRKWHFIVLKVGLLFLLCVSCGCPKTEKDGQRLNPVGTRHPLSIDGKQISVEVVITKAQQQMGLMYRTKVPEGTGMLFVYSKPQMLSFWMKNTPTKLSIAYIDSQGKILQIEPLLPLDETSVPSKDKVLWALEVPHGYFKKAGIKVGSRMTLSEDIRKIIQ